MTRRDSEPRKLESRKVGALLRSLLGPDGPELSCDQCFELIDQYVDLQHIGARADEQIPGMRAHLEGCTACREEYDSLLALSASERRAERHSGSPKTGSG